MLRIGVISRLTLDILFSGLDHLPCMGEEIQAASLSIGLGGGPIVTPVLLHRMGFPVKLGTFLDDSFHSRYVSPNMSSVRTLLPGVPFSEAPAQNKRNPFETDLETFRTDLLEVPNSLKTLADRYQGLSRASVSALFTSPIFPDDAYRVFSAFAAGQFSPMLLSDTFQEPVAVYPFRPTNTTGHETPFRNMSDAYDVYYARKDAVVRIQRNGAALRRVLENHLSRAENKLSAYTDAIESESKFEEYRLFGELLTANLYQVKRGQSSAVLDNYYNDPPTRCSIPLDPLLSPQDNAQRYYKRYRKSKTARDYALSQRDAVITEIQYLEGQLDNIDKCANLTELLEIREELIRERYIRPERKGGKPQNSGVSKPMSFRSSSGITILVGRNNRQNDQLTLHTAASEQLWLHAKNIPGSHVIVLENTDAIPPETIREAALLAAYYSHARASASVPIDYTPRKFVKKPTGAKPGMVIYSTNRTIFVTPDEAEVKRIARID